MTCFEFEQFLQEQLDLRRVALTAELHAHLQDCCECQKIVDSMNAVEHAVVAWRTLTPDVDLANQVLQRLADDKTLRSDRSNIEVIHSGPAASAFADNIQWTHEPARRNSITSVLALSVAALAVLIFTSVAWRSSEQLQMAKLNSNSTPTGVVPLDSSPQLQSDAAGHQKLDVLIHDTREAYAALVSQARQHVSTAEFLLPSPEGALPFRNERILNDMPNSLAPLQPWSSELRNKVESWIDQVLTSQGSST